MQIQAHIKPGSRKGPLVEEREDGSYIIYVREGAHDGEANEAVIRVLAEHFKIAPSRIALARGGKSRLKTFLIS